MHKNHLKYLLFFVGVMLLPLSAASQPPYLIGKVISKNEIVDFGKQKLIIIDFWATWCAPCIPATKQLEILQESRPNEVFVVALSDEQEDVISAYLQRIPIKVAVLQDNFIDGGMIKRFNVQRRPYSVLLTLDGTILYEGHPANITASMIDKYAAQESSKPNKKWNDLFTLVTNKETNTETKNTPPPARNKGLQIKRQADGEDRMFVENGIFYYSGYLSGLIKYLADCSSLQVIFKGVEDYRVSMSCGKEELLKSKIAVMNLIARRLVIKIDPGNKQVEGYVLNVANPKRLWDRTDKNAEQLYMVGTDRIEAKSATIQQIAALLSDIKESIYYYKGNDKRLYDWSFHYKYNNLMKEDLEDNFGIKLKKEKINLPVYNVTRAN